MGEQVLNLRVRLCPDIPVRDLHGDEQEEAAMLGMRCAVTPFLSPDCLTPRSTCLMITNYPCKE